MESKKVEEDKPLFKSTDLTNGHAQSTRSVKLELPRNDDVVSSNRTISLETLIMDVVFF
jgi:hypothetical protein